MMFNNVNNVKVFEGMLLSLFSLLLTQICIHNHKSTELTSKHRR